jgi:hypothetical protein
MCDALKADVPMCKLKPGLSIIRLLRDDAVKADVALAQVGHGVSPDPKPQSFAAIIRPDDVQADEAEMLVIGDSGDRADGLTVQLANEKSARVGGLEAERVMATGIPAFLGRPLDRQRDFFGLHRANDVVPFSLCDSAHDASMTACAARQVRAGFGATAFDRASRTAAPVVTRN